MLPLFLASLAWSKPSTPLLWTLGGHAFASQPDQAGSPGSDGDQTSGSYSGAQIPGYNPAGPAAAGGQAGYSTVQGPGYNPAVQDSATSLGSSGAVGVQTGFNAQGVPNSLSAEEQVNYNVIPSSGYSGAKGARADYKAFQNPTKYASATGQAGYSAAAQGSGYSPASPSSTEQQASFNAIQRPGYNPSDTSATGEYAGYYGSAGMPGYNAEQGYGTAGANAATTSPFADSTGGLAPATGSVTAGEYSAAYTDASGNPAAGYGSQAYPGGWSYPSGQQGNTATSSLSGQVVPGASAGTADVPPSPYLPQDQSFWHANSGYGAWGAGQETTAAPAELTTLEPSEEEETAPSAEGTTTSPEPTTPEPTSSEEEEETAPSSESATGHAAGSSSPYPGTGDMTWRYGAYREPPAPLPTPQSPPAGLGYGQAGLYGPSAGFMPSSHGFFYGRARGGGDEEGGRGQVVPLFAPGVPQGYPAAWAYLDSQGGDDD